MARNIIFCGSGTLRFGTNIHAKYSVLHIIYSMIDDEKYSDFVEANPYITKCHKKFVLRMRKKLNTAYMSQDSDKQIITYLKNALNNYIELGQFNQLLNTFIDVKTANYLIKKILKSSNPTDRRIMKQLKKLTTTSEAPEMRLEPCLCNKWEYMFENLSLEYGNLLYKDGHGIQPHKITYLDYGCGSGKKTIMMADKLELDRKSVYGTDINNWGPYSQTQKNIHSRSNQ
jgi:hypothetical protein